MGKIKITSPCSSPSQFACMRVHVRAGMLYARTIILYVCTGI